MRSTKKILMHTLLVSSTLVSSKAHLSDHSIATTSSQHWKRRRTTCATSRLPSQSCEQRSTRSSRNLKRAVLASATSPKLELLITEASCRETAIKSHSFFSSRETKQAGFEMSRFRESTMSWKFVARTKQTCTIKLIKKKPSRLTSRLSRTLASSPST